MLLSGIAGSGRKWMKTWPGCYVKDNAQYGILFVSPKVATQSVKWGHSTLGAAETVVLG
jgi:hypothetical protein